MVELTRGNATDQSKTRPLTVALEAAGISYRRNVGYSRFTNDVRQSRVTGAAFLSCNIAAERHGALPWNCAPIR